MGVFHRINFHTRMAINKVTYCLKEMLHPKTDEEIMAKLEARADAVLPEDVEEIRNTIRDHEKNEPSLTPEKTMLIFSRPEEHKCNAFTASSYRHKVHTAIGWAQKNGVNTFLADYCTPLGLLALEELIELRKAGEDFRVYGVRSTYIGKRKTYRLVRETPIEMAFLAARADYTYHELPEYMVRFVFPQAGIHCTERGLWYSKEKISPEASKLWGPAKHL